MATFASQTDLTIADIEEFLEATLGDIKGMDTEDREYDNIQDLWEYELKRQAESSAAVAIAGGSAQQSQWYSDAYQYWESEANCPLSDDGVLGGYGKLTPMDTRDSISFIEGLKANRPELNFDRVADCGAGIGRVTKNLLLPLFAHVDLIEQSPRLLASSAEYIGEGHERTTCVELGLQDFCPAPNTYDMIWIQWVIGHLHDLDFISFFKRCSAGLTPGGVIVLKDNCCESWTFVVDKSDSSVARCRGYMHILMHLSGLQVVMERRQEDFPEELYPVYMTALVPIMHSPP